MITRLSDIIDSDSQAELLAFFITATPRSFPLTELSRRLELSPQAIKEATEIMEKHNLVKTFTKQQTRFYILNHKHAMIPQLKTSLVKEHKTWPDELVSSLNKLGTFTGMFLSGVFVGRPELVVDLLLVGSVNQDKLNEFLRRSSKQFGGELNYSIMSAQEFRLRRDTFDRFIKDIFDYPHITLVDKSDQQQETAKPVAKTAVKPVVKPTPKVKPQPKPATKKVAKPAIKPVAKKVVVKKVAKPSKKAPQRAKSKSVSKLNKKTYRKINKKTSKKRR